MMLSELIDTLQSRLDRYGDVVMVLSGGVELDMEAACDRDRREPHNESHADVLKLYMGRDYNDALFEVDDCPSDICYKTGHRHGRALRLTSTGRIDIEL
jgi:hypothetical protein